MVIKSVLEKCQVSPSRLARPAHCRGGSRSKPSAEGSISRYLATWSMVILTCKGWRMNRALWWDSNTGAWAPTAAAAIPVASASAGVKSNVPVQSPGAGRACSLTIFSNVYHYPSICVLPCSSLWTIYLSTPMASWIVERLPHGPCPQSMEVISRVMLISARPS